MGEVQTPPLPPPPPPRLLLPVLGSSCVVRTSPPSSLRRLLRNEIACALCDDAGAIYILFGRLLMRDPEGGASGAEANEFYGLVLVSFWMNVVLLLDR